MSGGWKVTRVRRVRRWWGGRPAVLVTVGMLVAAGVGVTVGTALPQQPRQVTATVALQADTVTCTTDPSGYCTVGLQMLPVPAAVVVEPTAPLIHAVDQVTASAFRVQFLTSTGAPAASRQITFGYTAYAGGNPGPGPAPTSTAPTVTPTGAPVLSTTIEDTAIGTTTNTVSYAPAANWHQCAAGCNTAVASTANSSYRWASATGDKVTITWAGVQLKVYGVKEPQGGIDSIATDGAGQGTADWYRAAGQAPDLVWTSPVLASGNHTTVITLTGQHNPQATGGPTLTFDKADVYSVGVAPTTTPSASPSVSPTGGGGAGNGPLSGLPWLSGINGGDQVQGFGNWRGRAVDLDLAYTDRTSWGGVTNSAWMFNAVGGWPGRMSISQPLFPQNVGASIGACASGAYDSYWRQFGTVLVNNGRANSIVRVGWEFNGTYMYWHPDNDAGPFIGCFQKISTAIRATDPQVVIDWTINGHSTPPGVCGGSAFNCYPGDTYVDVIGTDNYDHYPPSPNQAAWNSSCNASEGICSVLTFARNHHKLFSVGEWGINHNPTAVGQGNAGGDNPFYIHRMWDLFQSAKGTLLYEAYFDDCEQTNVASTLYRSCGPNNPQASAAYLSHYHP